MCFLELGKSVIRGLMQLSAGCVSTQPRESRRENDFVCGIWLVLGEKAQRERRKAIVSQRVTQKVLRIVFLLSILYE